MFQRTYYSFFTLIKLESSKSLLMVMMH